MGWLSALFASSTSTQYSRKGQALSNTHEAFSLPTSSPISASHREAFSSDPPQTPDTDSIMTPGSYTYPPPSPSSYSYVPTFNGSRPASTSLLPTHHDTHNIFHSPKFAYPPLSNTWSRIRIWLNREYPELGDTLNYGILPQDLAELEVQFGFTLPPAVRDSYLCVDGQEAESAAGCSEGLFFGLKLLPLEDVLQEWRFWREVDMDPATGANSRLREVMESIPPGWVRKEYSQRGWIPLIADKVGNYIGVDLNPGEGGSLGQVIVFGRDFDTKIVLWRGDGPAGWGKWLASFVEDLENGEGFEIGNNTEGSGDDEDDLGYESYFYDGTGRGQGDGGGDTGSGAGLRLSGEYRGWNVLEALADRSVKRWHEAGIITDTSLLQPEDENKLQEPVVVDLTHEPKIQTDAPVLANVDTSTSSPVAPLPSKLPTISVTRPPVPAPVILPQPSDILPPADSSQSSSFDEDLESGRSAGLRDTYFSSRQSKPQSPAAQDDNISSSPQLQPVSSALSASENAEIPDLLADLTPAMDTKPITPSSPAPVPLDVPVIPIDSLVLDEIKDSQVENTPKPTESEGLDTGTTIRLVGGGGVSGIAKPHEGEKAEAEEGTDTDAASNTEPVISEPTSNNTKTHKKAKSSLASLKKLSNIGRKRDSNNSTKGSVSAPVAS